MKKIRKSEARPSEQTSTTSKTSAGSVDIQIEHTLTAEQGASGNGTSLRAEKLLNQVIAEAFRLKASDIHLEPSEGEYSVRYRINGSLREGNIKISSELGIPLLDRIKTISGVNVAEKRVPQDGRFAVRVKEKPLEFRVNVVPTPFGENAVMRLLDRSGANLTLDQLGFLPDTKQKFMKSLKKQSGLVLVIGPTGSGKSFTLLAALSATRAPGKKIITAENPIEYNLKGVVQVQTNPDLVLSNGKRFTFAEALRSFLRQDTDVIMVGEIRDDETGHICCEAAMAGHLVLSTVHANDATSVVGRLVEMGVPPYIVSSALECVLAQRLVRTLCKECKKPDTKPSRELISLLEKAGIDYKKTALMKRVGCNKCSKFGLKGRTAIHELFVMDDEVRALCKKGVKDDEVRALAVKNGMRSFLQDGLTKVSKGLTTLDEVLAAMK